MTSSYSRYYHERMLKQRDISCRAFDKWKESKGKDNKEMNKVKWQPIETAPVEVFVQVTDMMPTQSITKIAVGNIVPAKLRPVQGKNEWQYIGQQPFDQPRYWAPLPVF